MKGDEKRNGNPPPSLLRASLSFRALANPERTDGDRDHVVLCDHNPVHRIYEVDPLTWIRMRLASEVDAYITPPEVLINETLARLRTHRSQGAISGSHTTVASICLPIEGLVAFSTP